MTTPTIVADLHTHTVFSDGEMTPLELYDYYHQAGYRGLAITDHDTLEGVRQLAAHLSPSGHEPRLIPAVELTLAVDSAEYRGSIHLLLYFSLSLLEDASFLRDMECLFSHARGQALLRRRIEAINRHLADHSPSVRLQESDFAGYRGQITRRAIFTELVGHGLPGDETRRLLANDSPAYIPSGVAPDLAADILGSYPLLRILAHPGAGSFPGESIYKEVNPPLPLIRTIIIQNKHLLRLDGLELFYPAHPPKIESAVRSLAEELGVSIFTGGSDCHDMTRRPPGTCGLDQASWQRFLADWESI
jgi:hypothetical protein